MKTLHMLLTVKAKRSYAELVDLVTKNGTIRMKIRAALY